MWGLCRGLALRGLLHIMDTSQTPAPGAGVACEPGTKVQSCPGHIWTCGRVWPQGGPPCLLTYGGQGGLGPTFWTLGTDAQDSKGAHLP